MSAGGIDGSDFSRRKKHPDLAYRAHQVNKQIKTKHKVLILKVIQKYLVIEIYIWTSTKALRTQALIESTIRKIK